MIEARHLTKRYGHTVAVDEASFDLTRDETDYHAGELAGSSKGI
jgi:ABC-type branched-subunit amino acid transport system ATPase component